MIIGRNDRQVGEKAIKLKVGDILNCELINSLSHPLIGVKGDNRYDIETICIQTGCVRFDVGGPIQIGEMIDFDHILDGNYNKHEIDDFYLD
ncbi:hypothetical protein NVP1228O_47 [Vibrio phage 1.228.O._10N.261.49.C1]|nr:hypothetical protein NVP1157O_42 [Vibrio phage 1.157.O._10N.261.45.B7]AUR96641.1 hypothetical protein NVP1228O_47 [Vibrio phage 1.228.O._10N.261.49.C1]